MLWFFLLLLLSVQTPIAPDVPQTVLLEAGGGPVNFVYEVTEPQIVTITASAVDVNAEPPLDITLEILLDETRLAFNDDHLTDADGLQTGDALIAGLRLLEPGMITLRVNSFSGAQSGEARLTVESAPLLAECPSDTQVITLDRSRVFSCTLELTVADSVTITARDVSGGLDPVLVLANSEGEQVIFNDDHGTLDFSLNTLDARIADHQPVAAGTYTLTLHDFNGWPGKVDLILDISS